MMIDSLIVKTLLLSVTTLVFQILACDRTCDVLYFADYDDLPADTALTFAKPYLGLQYSGYTVKDFTNNGFLSIPSGPNALLVENPYIPTNRATITVDRNMIRILDPESAYLACVVIDKETKQIKKLLECDVLVTGSGPNYYVTTTNWHFKPDTRRHSNLHLFNLGNVFNNITTIELRLLNDPPKRRDQEYALVLDEFIYGGRLGD